MKTERAKQLKALQEELAYYQKYEQKELHYGRVIQTYREIAGYSRETLAEALNIGVRTLEHTETERNMPSLELLHQLTLLLDFEIQIQKGCVYFGHSQQQAQDIFSYYQSKLQSELKRWSKSPISLESLLLKVEEFTLSRFQEEVGWPIPQFVRSDMELFERLTEEASIQPTDLEAFKLSIPSCRFEMVLEEVQFELIIEFQLMESNQWVDDIQNAFCQYQQLAQANNSPLRLEDWLCFYRYRFPWFEHLMVQYAQASFLNVKKIPTCFI